MHWLKWRDALQVRLHEKPVSKRSCSHASLMLHYCTPFGPQELDLEGSCGDFCTLTEKIIISQAINSALA
jgi:hypothetical protein